LNVIGIIVNPPVPVKCKLGKRKGKTIGESPHMKSKSFDLAGAGLRTIEKIIRNYRKDGGPVAQILVEKKNNCVHITLK
jgi:hypothetical protein